MSRCLDEWGNAWETGRFAHYEHENAWGLGSKEPLEPLLQSFDLAGAILKATSKGSTDSRGRASGVAQHLQSCRNVVVLCGAGVSTSAGLLGRLCSHPKGLFSYFFMFFHGFS